MILNEKGYTVDKEYERKILVKKADEVKRLCESLIKTIEDKKDDPYKLYDMYTLNESGAYELIDEIKEMEYISGLHLSYSNLEVSYDMLKEKFNKMDVGNDGS